MQKCIIRKKDFVDQIIFIMIFLQLTIFEFMGYIAILNKALVVLIIIHLYIKNGKNNVNNKVFISGIVFIMLFIGSSLCRGGTLSVFFNNFSQTFYPMVYAYFIYDLNRRNSIVIKNFLEKGFWIINIVFVVNLVVMIMQITYPYSINAKIVYNEITYYPDTISGLFQYASTHLVGIFTGFVFVYNCAWARRLKKRVLKKMLYVYTVVTLLVSVYISLNNDNKMFFILFPIIVVGMYFVNQSKINRKEIIRTCLLYTSPSPRD